MKYIYTANGCKKCDELKQSYRSYNVNFVERSANRLKTPKEDWDQIDIDAFVALTMNNMELPVEVEA